MLLGERLLEPDAEERLHVSAAGAADDVVQPAQVVLHGADFGQAVERAHDEEGVAQPAVAVVPVALRVRRLGDARRHRRDDGAGLLELAHLQRDGGTDDGLLPFERQGQAARPATPVERRLLFEAARGFLDAGRERLVRAKHQADRAVQRHPGGVEHVGQRRVGVQAQGARRQDEAQMVAAARDLRRRGAPLAARPDDKAQARMADQRAHAPDELGGAERPVVMEEARAEVDDLDTLAGVVEEARAQDRRARLVRLLGTREALELDTEDRVFAQAAGAVHQGVEDRIAVEARHAAPDDPGARIDQGADGAVADQSEVEAGGVAAHGMGAGIMRNNRSIGRASGRQSTAGQGEIVSDGPSFHAGRRSRAGRGDAARSAARLRLRRHARADRGPARRRQRARRGLALPGQAGARASGRQSSPGASSRTSARGSASSRNS